MSGHMGDEREWIRRLRLKDMDMNKGDKCDGKRWMQMKEINVKRFI